MAGHIVLGAFYGLKVAGALAEVGIVAAGEGVVALHSGYQILIVDAGDLGHLLQRVTGPEVGLRLLHFIQILVEHRETRGLHTLAAEIVGALIIPLIQRADTVVIGNIVQTVFLVVVQNIRADDGEAAVLLLLQEAVAGISGVVHEILVHEPLAIQIYHQIGLAHGLRQRFEDIGDAGGVVGDLHGDFRLLGADTPCHIHAVSVDTGDAEGEHILSPLEAQMLLDHVHIVADTAGSDDDGAAHALHFRAVIPDGADADNLSLITHHQLLNGGVELEVHAQLEAVVGHVFDVDGGTALRGLVGAGHLDDVLGLVGVLEILVHALELGSHGHEPVDSVGRHIEPAAYQLGIGLPVGVLHELHEGLILRPVVHILFLKLRFHGENGHAHIGGAAGGTGLFKGHHIAAAGGVQGFLRLYGGAEAGHTGGNHHNIGFHHNFHACHLNLQ